MSIFTADKRMQFSVVWFRRVRRAVATATAAVVVAGMLVGTGAQVASASTAGTQYLIEGISASVIVGDGGTIDATLTTVNEYIATMTPSVAGQLAKVPGSIVTPDQTVSTQSWDYQADSTTHAPSAVYPTVTQATSLWSQGINGSGVGVAVLDTGINASLPDLAGRVIDGVDLSGASTPSPYTDQYGHGTFIAGLIASSGVTSNGAYMGEAPGANLISIKVAGANGITSEGQVIQGIEWAIAHQAADNIRVLNLSIGLMPSGPSGTDPLDQAVEQAWNAGIVVVAAAGNYGPDNLTISVPGNDPLAITVGALDDGGQTNPANYMIPSFTSVGPTLYNGWLKPDLIAPGRSVISLADPGSTIYTQNPSAIDPMGGFTGSGTSFSTAIVSGIVAMMIQAHPSWTPDNAKSQLIATALTPPVNYPLVAGHGIANALGAVMATGVPQLSQASAAAAEQSQPTADNPIQKAWAVSSWNADNWSGVAWNGVAWNGVAWNGVAWNGVAWNGVAWNSDAYN